MESTEGTRLPARSQHVAQVLAAAGIAGRVRELSDSARTAAEAAAALGCDVGAIANSLIFISDDEPVLVLTSGRHKVDTAALAARWGGAVCGAPLPSRSARPRARRLAALPPSAIPNRFPP